jgi:muramoyltetrapeptide carboxypeptidase
MIKIPPYLKKGDTIGITCPAGYMAKEKAQTCIDTLQQWGYQVMVGNTLGSNSANYFSGTDEERLNELQAMLDDDSINAILCGRGGYGTSRIIDRLDFKKFKRKPKWIIGFSDITVLHNHIFSNYKTASIHAPMASAFNDGGAKNEYVQSLKKMLAGKRNKYSCAPHPNNQQGKATGELVGGNLSLLAHLTGTPSDINPKNKLLFIEDIGEYIYNIDRMLYQLKRSGKLDNLAGLIIGGFTDMKDTDRPFGKNMDEVLHDIVKEYAYPVCFHFPVSHGTENYALKIGGTYQLNVGRTKVQLSEQ